MPYGWEGEKVRLVPVDKDRHFETSLQWINDPEVTAWTIDTGDVPTSRVAQEEFFDRIMRETTTQIYFAIETLSGEHIGFNALQRIDRVSGVAMAGSYIGHRDYWGQGYALDAARVRNRFAFEVLGLRMLVCEIMAEHIGALRMVQKAGYREVGRIPRRVWKRGAYRDLVILALERD